MILVRNASVSRKILTVWMCFFKNSCSETLTSTKTAISYFLDSESQPCTLLLEKYQKRRGLRICFRSLSNTSLHIASIFVRGTLKERTAELLSRIWKNLEKHLHSVKKMQYTEAISVSCGYF